MSLVQLGGAFALAGLFLAPSSAHGQIDGWGVKAGITSMTGRGDGLLEEKVGRTPGVLIGGATRIGVTGPLSLRPELLFV